MRPHLYWLVPHLLAIGLSFAGLLVASRNLGALLFVLGFVIELLVWIVAVHDRSKK